MYVRVMRFFRLESRQRSRNPLSLSVDDTLTAQKEIRESVTQLPPLPLATSRG